MGESTAEAIKMAAIVILIASIISLVLSVAYIGKQFFDNQLNKYSATAVISDYSLFILKQQGATVMPKAALYNILEYNRTRIKSVNGKSVDYAIEQLKSNLSGTVIVVVTSDKSTTLFLVSYY